MALFAAALSGCAEQPIFDSQAYLRQRFAEQVGAARAAEIEVPFALSTEVAAQVNQRLRVSGGEVQRANDIVDFIFHDLDLTYELVPTRNANDTWTSRRGNCLSFVNLFVGISRRQRLNAFYVEVEDAQSWSYAKGTVISQGHIVAGLSVGGELQIYDFVPDRPKTYRKFRPIDDPTAAAHYFNNLAAEALLAGDPGRALTQVELATAIAPTFEKGLNNLGVILARRGADEEALAALRQGLEVAPASEAILTNLLRLYQQMGRAADAEATFSRLDGLRVENPYFYVYKAERVLAAGDTDAALAHLAEALRRDSELPEVHLALARVYLARGEVAEARHHLARALRLDATNAEARRFAEMLGPGT